MSIEEYQVRKSLLDFNIEENWADFYGYEYTDELKHEDAEMRKIKEEILGFCTFDRYKGRYRIDNWPISGLMQWANVDYVRNDRSLDQLLETSYANGMYGYGCYIDNLDGDMDDLKELLEMCRRLNDYPCLDEYAYDNYLIDAEDRAFEDFSASIRNAPWWDEDYARINAVFEDDDMGGVYITNEKELIDHMRESA